MVATTITKCTNPACDQGDVDSATPSNPCNLSEKCASACAAYGRVCPCAARSAGRAACKATMKLTENSEIFKGKPDFCMLDCDDLIIGDKLGEGGFSVVHDVLLNAGDEKGQTFAVKYLKRKVMVNQHHFELGAADLATEANFLATLNHPHIVKLHGITAGSVESNVATGNECGFFIVVDRLVTTLEAQIEAWHDEWETHSGNMLYRRTHEYRVKRKAFLMERLKVAVAIADAIQYLHSLHIIYRDLKPENMGFDKEGVIKLFDFGLAKELKPNTMTDDGRYQMTGNTGSRRYMAPEVAKEIPYNQSADVYSFGILLWELCAMEKPFAGYSSGKHMHQVVIGGERPRMDTVNTSFWPMNLQWLLKRCWAPFPVSRPTIDVVKQSLLEIIHCDESECHKVSSLHTEAEEAPIVPPEGGFAALKPTKPQINKGVTIGHEVGSAEKGKRFSSWGFGKRRSHG